VPKNLTAEALADCMGCSTTRAAIWVPFLHKAMACYGIEKPIRMAAFLAQVAHESDGLKSLEENLNYSADGLLKTWPNRFTPAEAREYARNPERIANKAYARAELGNGPESSGDGWRFRGSGLFQLTGRDAFRRFGKAHGIDAERHPEMVRAQDWPAAMAAAWEWDSKKLWAFADRDDIDSVSKKLNGGTNGLEERRIHYVRAKKILGA
jgi:putative chitinase